MGWRSWNAFYLQIDQEMMEANIDMLADKGRTVGGVHKSLAEVGYSDAGLDDGWQACATGVNGSFHDHSGKPLINTTRFPSLKAMVAKAHSLGITAGWYGNNCDCGESGFDDAWVDHEMRGDVASTVELGFDSIKLDGCGQELNLTRWEELFNASGKAVMLENCHWGNDAPTLDWCPFHMFRSSPDITSTPASWSNMYLNLQTMNRFSAVSRPGCWAYPDMLETGNFQRYEEDRANFGAWAITSSPLILSLDLRNKSMVDRVWEVITNEEAIAVNQDWAGEPGGLVVSESPGYSGFPWLVACDAMDKAQRGWSYNNTAKRVQVGHSCLDHSYASHSDPGFLALAPCDPASTTQTFHYNQGALTPDGAQCVAPFSYQWHGGPGLSLQPCEEQMTDAHKDQHFSISGDGRIIHQNGQCVAAKASAPLQADLMQVWTKKLTGGKQGIFAINADKTTVHTVELALAPGVSYKVRDVWAQKDIGNAKGTLKLKVPHRDSAFVVLTPVAESLFFQ